MSWLQSLFDTRTVDKAKRDWRLLILDGHCSHCTLQFLNWWWSNRILVAIFLPHFTHRLQPLDVSLFRPLATYYNQEVDHHTRLSQGLTALTKRDFFTNFYSAYDRAFTEDNIKLGWHKTGLEPFVPEQVLNILKKEEPEEEEDALPDRAPSASHSSCCLDSPSTMRIISSCSELNTELLRRLRKKPRLSRGVRTELRGLQQRRLRRLSKRMRNSNRRRLRRLRSCLKEISDR